MFLCFSGAIVGSVLVGVMVILFCIFLSVWFVRRRRTEEEKNGKPLSFNCLVLLKFCIHISGQDRTLCYGIIDMNK